MQETKRIHLFDIKPIMSDVEQVIQRGLNKMLVNYIERHEVLEKTHKQLMLLPSIAEELNRRNGKSWVNDSEDEDEPDHFANNSDLIHKEISKLENKLQRLEKKYDTIIPILDKLVTKITTLNDDVKAFKRSEIKVETQEDKHTSDIIEKSSVVKTSENENIEIHIQESEELEEEEISGDEDVNPLLVTCSTISLNKEVIEEHKIEEPTVEESKIEESKVEESVEEEVVEEEDEELSVEQELGIEDEPAEKSEEVVEEEEEEVVEEEEEEVVEEEEEEVVEEESAEEEVVEEEVVEEETAEEEVVEEEEEEVVEEESAEEEVVQEEAAEEEVVEEEAAEEEASVETETKEEEEEEDEDIFEIEIDDKTYCTNDDENGFIWELTEEGEQGDKVGYLKDGEPFFYADEN